ncbi:MAG: hypothetical protein ACKVWR_21700, partial [Acidimicrobiales bacterium]
MTSLARRLDQYRVSFAPRTVNGRLAWLPAAEPAASAAGPASASAALDAERASIYDLLRELDLFVDEPAAARPGVAAVIS